MNLNKSLNRLKEGNRRFVNSSSKSLTCYHIARISTIEAQKPFAIVLACSDSRVSPEIIFDQGIGDLFVIRVAGHILSEAQWETIKFGVEILGIETILVLGHEACGAVQAAIEKVALDIPVIAEQIAKGISNRTDINEAAKSNVHYVVSKLKDLLKDKSAAAVGGFYHISSGEVEFFDYETPLPSALTCAETAEANPSVSYPPSKTEMSLPPQ